MKDIIIFPIAILVFTVVSVWWEHDIESRLSNIEGMTKNVPSVEADEKLLYRTVVALVAARSNDIVSVNRELDNVYRSLDSVLFVSTNRIPKVIADSISSAVNKRLECTEDRMLNDHETRLTRIEQELKRWKRR